MQGSQECSKNRKFKPTGYEDKSVLWGFLCKRPSKWEMDVKTEAK